MDYRLENWEEESTELIYLILLRSELKTIAEDSKYVQNLLHKQEFKKDQMQRTSCASIPTCLLLPYTCLFCTGVEDEG